MTSCMGYGSPGPAPEKVIRYQAVTEHSVWQLYLADALISACWGHGLNRNICWRAQRHQLAQKEGLGGARFNKYRK